MTSYWTLLGLVGAAAAALGFFVCWLLGRAAQRRRLRMLEGHFQGRIKEVEQDAEARRKEALLEAKEEVLKAKDALEREGSRQRAELQKLEGRLRQREETLERKAEHLDRRERELFEQEERIARRQGQLKEEEAHYQALLQEQVQRLEQISGMSSEEAKGELKEVLLDEVKAECAREVRRIEEETKAKAEQEARNILSLAVQRCAADFVAETTVSVVDLPSDEMKGRIIGREGRNIRALEVATGIDLIIDDTPEAVILSGFDPIKRETARLALERLIADGRIHPGRIEDIVAKVKKEMEKRIQEEGEHAIFEVGLEGINPELVKLLGRLRYRTSYSQNVLLHCKEVAFLCGIMAAELGLDVKMAKRAGILHDIGKAVDHESEGSHTQIGVELARRYNEPFPVVNAIASHHEDEPPQCLEAVLVAAADTLSAARPGARREMLETYVKRLQKLEEIADSFKGVDKAYAIQAGREVRVIVKPEGVDDAHVAFLARDIARRIEEELTYPGEIKVTVIRETRAVEYAQ
ncbi:MAG: ribonuclease Y [Nitrospinota bacterium]